jgi:glycosyltransferase involved in cell wall biosynthesis
LKVLVAHNRYTSKLPSGENAVVDDEIALLTKAGLDVISYLPSSDDIGALPLREKAALPAAPIRFGPGVRQIERLIAAERPDILHLHNPYPLISPWIVRSASRAGVPVVHSVHNYRIACMKGTFYREGRVCEDCLGRRVKWPGALHGCYRGSRPQSVAMGAGLTFHHSTWRSIDRHLVLSDWMREKLIEQGIPPGRIALKRNPVEGPTVAPPLGRGLLFAGRLDEEKGIDLLLEAWVGSEAADQATLTIVGDGPLRGLVEARASTSDSIRFLGQVSPSEVNAQIAAAAAIVIPSRCYEGMPRVLAEAFARGRAVVTTARPLGPVLEHAGFLASAEPRSLASAMERVLESAGPLGAAARRRWELEFKPSVVIAQVQKTYDAVVGRDTTR